MHFAADDVQETDETEREGERENAQGVQVLLRRLFACAPDARSLRLSRLAPDGWREMQPAREALGCRDAKGEGERKSSPRLPLTRLIPPLQDAA